MTAPKKGFWVFHSIFWTVAGLALFLYGLRYGHWEIALIRNIYSPLLGFGVSFVMSVLYAERMPQRNAYRLLFVLAASVVGALLSALIVNPITYGLLGQDLRVMTAGQIFTDGLYFALFYLVWSLLYFQISGVPLFGQAATPDVASGAPPDTLPLEAITVTREGAKLKLHPRDITHIEANGDYVEFFTATEKYFKQGTIGSYERALGAGPFLRIHRSILINSEKITAITGPQKGQYWIKLEGDREVRSSRNAQTLVEGLLPKAE